MRGSLWLAALFSINFPCYAQQSLPAPSPEPLPASVRQVMQATGIEDQHLALVVLPAEGGPARYSHRADVPMSPASTLKVLTTVSALDTLGPDYHWHTALLSDGARKGDRLRGDLYLRGDGEPDLQPEHLLAMLRELRASGVRRLDGDLVLDRSYFQPLRFDQGVPPFDSTPAQYYNVIPDALVVHSNMIDLQLSSTADSVRVSSLTPLNGVEVASKLTLVDTPCAEWDEEWPAPDVETAPNGRLRVVLHGEYPRNCDNHTAVNAIDRDQYLLRLMRSQWQAMGGVWHGQVRTGAAPAGAKLVAEHRSAALSEIIHTVNKRSDNLMARLLYLTMGHEAAAKAAAGPAAEGAAPAAALAAPATGTLADGQGAVRRWLAQHGINDQGLILENGSGLSRIERISPEQMAGVLGAAARSTWSPEFLASLPLYGFDGSKRPALKVLTPGSGRIKGGTLSNTVSAAGYVRDTSGRNWIVVATINRPEAEPGRAVLDAMIIWVAQHPLPATGG